MVTDAKLKEIIFFKITHTEQETLEIFNITSESLNRYIREAKKRNIINSKHLKSLDLCDKLGEQEISKFFNNKHIDQIYKTINIVGTNDKYIKFAAMSDTHFGSNYTDPEYFLSCIKFIENEGCQFITIGGDITEGMSSCQGHCYEVTHLGYEAQKNHARQMLSTIKIPTYIIDGNHDRWFLKAIGANIVKDIAESLLNVEYLGSDEGDINIDNISIKMWHGGDASSAAYSWRLQKLAGNAFENGLKKPNILLAGHVHKMGYIYEKCIHCVSTGSIQKQSSWMKGKIMTSHTGFFIIEFRYNESGIVSFKPEWFPFYK